MKTSLKTFRSIVASLLAIALLFGSGFLVGRLSDDKATEVPKAEETGIDLQLPGEVEKMVVTVDEVEAKILEIGELTSCEGDYIVTKGKDFTRYALDDIPVPGTTNHIELTCYGTVKAGYDLKEVSIRLDEESKTIYVSLPDAKINSNQLIWDDSVVCKEQNNILNPIDFEQYKTLIAEIKEEGLKEAESQGLYDSVEENAKNLITNFLGCFVDYTVVFM